MKDLKNKNAITLFALIITVIILLILATVTISLIINSGILDHAQHGVDRYSGEEELEQIKLAVASARLKGNGFLTTENLNSELQERFGEEAKPIDDYWKFNGYKISNNGQLERTLPKEFQEVEYIEKNGNQFIDTRFTPDYSKNIDIQIVAIPKSSDNRYCLLSNYAVSKHLSLELHSNNRGRCFYNNGNINSYTGTVSISTKNTYIFNYDATNKRYTLTFNNESVNGNMNANETSGNSMYVFTDRLKRFSIFNQPFKLYNLKISENEKSIKCFIPCYSTTTVTDVDGIERPKDTIGLYDTVEGKFYVNQGEGTFLKGNDV